MKPAIVVAVLFRALDAFRIFDTIYIFNQGAQDRSEGTVFKAKIDVLESMGSECYAYFGCCTPYSSARSGSRSRSSRKSCPSNRAGTSRATCSQQAARIVLTDPQQYPRERYERFIKQFLDAARAG